MIGRGPLRMGAENIAARIVVMKKLLYSLLVCTAFAPGLVLSQTEGVTLGDLLIERPWARPLPAVSKNGAVYMILSNGGTSTDSLVSASTPVAERAEIHTHIHENGMMMMRQVQKIELPGGGRAVLEPGGLHLMLIGINSPMTEGKEFPVTLRFEHAGQVEVTVRVGNP